ncbi:MAG TPA: Ku protein, partial [Thermoanaerobaculia bacterium]
MAEDDVQETEGGGGGARAFWSGTITFGLVSVPVALFAANRGRGVGLRMVTEEGTPLERRYVCPEEEKELGWDEIVRGYEIEKGKFVVVTDEELEAIEPRKTREIDLRLFVDRESIDPALFERAYFLTPTAGSNKAYRLLAAVMEETGRAGIATFVMRTREYVVAILAENGILHAETLRFQDEIRSPKEIGLPKKPKSAPADVKTFEREIAKRAKKVDFAEFLDDYSERLQDLAAKKQKKKEGVVKAPAEAAEAEGGEVIDLLEVLRKSMASAGEGRRAPKKAATA